MDWLEQFNHAMTYIEQHLTDTIDYQQLASIAGCPYYQFQKIFTYMTNISLNEYIRRRKMSLAAVDLMNHHMRVIDVAYKYGYDSPTAFNRAFQSVHGIAPSVIRKTCQYIQAYPPFTFSLSIQGSVPLQFQIVEKDSFRIVGIDCPLSHQLENNFKEIPYQWNQAVQNGTITQLISFMDSEPKGLLGLSIHHSSDWKYMIAVSSQKESQDFNEYIIPNATWAIFKGHGHTKTIQDLEKRVILEWLPTSGYEYANIPDIEVYINPNPENAIYEYWLPVIQKEE
ncbi:AraC family transcriptional regulator [Longibaculum muris]|uniref:AraC family transcriptional regulator n=1 Tax=Longibaculum muris TaxID=1796628 RepID=UPI0022E40F4A|nr:GyrI-like domain-containing protein [Longibaculum muris]